MKFVFIAKHRNVWPVAWLCDALGVSRSGSHAWLNRSPSARSRGDEALGQQVKQAFLPAIELMVHGVSSSKIAAHHHRNAHGLAREGPSRPAAALPVSAISNASRGESHPDANAQASRDGRS
jgi:hypothetical protein